MIASSIGGVLLHGCPVVDPPHQRGREPVALGELIEPRSTDRLLRIPEDLATLIDADDVGWPWTLTDTSVDLAHRQGFDPGDRAVSAASTELAPGSLGEFSEQIGQ
ncbi:hypothetical protein Ae707Ps1_6176 [Pseudonocardia sp. Ae707_Ps1]|nr:hypothetical protein Ae707Ps1_6176 [Pseudonocardia sp. Ae707_Ps1]